MFYYVQHENPLILIVEVLVLIVEVGLLFRTVDVLILIAPWLD